MARPSTGSITPEPQADGTITFRLRFPASGVRETVLLHERRACDCGCHGGWTQRTAETELRNIIAKVAAGVWERPRRSAPVPVKRMPTFHEYASYWLQAHKDGVLGEKALGKASYKDYRWRLSHLLPFFGPFLLDEIDSDLCLEFKAHKLKEAKEIAEAIAAGADLRDERNRKIKPIGPSSLKRFLDTLRTILDEAIEDKYIPANPAHGRRLKVKVPKPKRTFLERDELIATEDAALSQDPSLADYHRAHREAQEGSGEAAVALALSEGLRPPQVAARVGLSKATVGFHCKKFGRSAGVYVGRRALVCTLGRAGVRASELCDIKIGQLVLHGVEGSRFDIPDAKTETGIRKVEMTDDLVEVIIEHIDRLRRAGFDTGPEAPLFPNARGGRMCRQRVGEIVADAAKLADERMRARGLPPLPHVTPHTLRRTYISIALLANKFDIKWVMDQVGHADSTMTLDVYAKLQRRVNRVHGAEFDRLMREARTHLYRNGNATSAESEERNPGGVLDGVLDGTPKKAPRKRKRSRGDAHKNSSFAGNTRRGEAPLGYGRTQFSVVCSTN
jgi:integrase